MDKYLIQLLKEVNTIIIPGIGALTLVNKATGEVMFLPFMKFDDEKLAKHIAEKENWSLNDAKNLVAKYVRDINAKLAVGDTYDIYQFGSFSKKTGGEIEFTAWNGTKSTVEDEILSDNIYDENEAKIVVATETIPEIDNEAISEIKTVDNALEEIKSDSNFSFEVDAKNITEVTENDIASISNEPISIELANLDFDVENESIVEKEAEIPESVASVSTEKSNEIHVEISTNEETIEDIESEVEKALEIENEHVVVPETIEIIEKATTIIPTATTVLSVEEQMNDDLDLAPINETKPIVKKPILEKTVSDKKKRRIPAFLWILIALLLAGGIYTGINYDHLKQHIPFLADKGKLDTKEKESEKSKINTTIEDSENLNEANSIENQDVEENQMIDESDNVQEEANISEPTSTITSTNAGFSVDKNLPFQVIVGSFSEKANAERKVKSLKNAGFAPEIIGQYDGLYFVSLGSFNSMAEVKAKSAEINEVGSYWVFKK